MKENANEPIQSKELQDELVGILTAISLVSKRLAKRLTQMTEQESVNK